jgi:anti-sigma B factor antagonist
MSDIQTNSPILPAARQEGDALIATVRGEVDLHNSPELRGTLLDLLNRLKPKRLVLNLEQVPYMDSSAIAVLVESLQKLKRSGGRVFLTGLQPRVKGLLEIARLDQIFSLVNDEAEALKK